MVVCSSMGVRAALVQGVGGGRWGWLRVVGRLEHGEPRPPSLFDPTTSTTASSSCSTVEAGGVHGNRASNGAVGAGRAAWSSAQEAPPSGKTQHRPTARTPGGDNMTLLQEKRRDSFSLFKKQIKSLFHLLQDNKNTTNKTKRDSEMYIQLLILPHRAQNFPNSSSLSIKARNLCVCVCACVCVQTPLTNVSV